MCTLCLCLCSPCALGRKCQTAVCISGAQGCGKSILIEIFIDIIGGEFVQQCTTSVDLFSTFNGSFIFGKLMTFVEETPKVCFADKKNYAQLKTLVTANILSLNVKNKKKNLEPVFSQLMFFSNEQYPLWIDHEDRRIFLARATTTAEDGTAFSRWARNNMQEIKR